MEQQTSACKCQDDISKIDVGIVNLMRLHNEQDRAIEQSFNEIRGNLVGIEKSFDYLLSQQRESRAQLVALKQVVLEERAKFSMINRLIAIFCFFCVFYFIKSLLDTFLQAYYG